EHPPARVPPGGGGACPPRLGPPPWPNIPLVFCYRGLAPPGVIDPSGLGRLVRTEGDMGLLDDLLKQVTSGNAPAADVHAAYDQVAPAVPPGELSDGIAPD